VDFRSCRPSGLWTGPFYAGPTFGFVTPFLFARERFHRLGATSFPAIDLTTPFTGPKAGGIPFAADILFMQPRGAVTMVVVRPLTTLPLPLCAVFTSGFGISPSRLSSSSYDPRSARLFARVIRECPADSFRTANACARKSSSF